jgi:hypothetical protein
MKELFDMYRKKTPKPAEEGGIEAADINDGTKGGVKAPEKQHTSLLEAVQATGLNSSIKSPEASVDSLKMSYNGQEMTDPEEIANTIMGSKEIMDKLKSRM